MRALNYSGNCESSIGRLLGPDVHGAFYEVKEVSYDREGDRSTVYVLPVTRYDDRSVVRDGFGQPFIVS